MRFSKAEACGATHLLLALSSHSQMLSSVATSVSIKKFRARPCVQRALASPHKVESVLSFFFGVDYDRPSVVESAMRRGDCFQGEDDMRELWYNGGPDYDALCQPFRETVRAAGRNEFIKAEKESTLQFSTVDQAAAQLILCDQLARNIFRGTPEAFAYEESALTACRDLTDSLLSPRSPRQLSGEIYPPYIGFMVTALIHSESLADHERATEILDHCYGNTPEHLASTWDDHKLFAKNHKDVIDRFGRYPHRNKAKGRTNTPEEDAWLTDIDNLPAWAKSQ